MLDQSFNLSDSNVLNDVFQFPTLGVESGLGRSDTITPILPKALNGMDSSLFSNYVEDYRQGLENRWQSSQSLSSVRNGGDFLTGQSSFVGLSSSVDRAGNTLATARAITVGSTATSYTDWVGSTDTNDYYRFTLANSGNFNLRMTGLTADADVRLLSSSGSVIDSSTNGGTASESISRQLSAGTYYIRVFPYSGSTNYNLSVSATGGGGGSDLAGNTLATARAITVGSTATSYTDWVGSTDTNDFYRFSLSNTSNFNLGLTGLTADADVELLRSDGISVITRSVQNGTTPETISSQPLSAGTYYIRVYPYQSANTNYTLSVSATTQTSNNLSFNSFNILDASGDSSNNSIFQGGAIRLNYSLSSSTSLANVRLEAVRNGSSLNLGTWTGASASNSLINLSNFSGLTGGDYQFRAVARNTSGQEFFSNSQSVRILSWTQPNNTIYGGFGGNTLNYSGALGTGTVVVGRGGTDTLNLSSVSRSSVTGINGVSLGSFNPLSSTNQAIFRGTAFDYLTLADGREVYFQGIENLRFGDGSTLELQRRTNDTHFSNQWNLHVSDVGSAWRFTQGSNGVLLVSLDSGILTAQGAQGGIVDIATGRLIVDATDDDNSRDNGHGHQAISVMSSTPNNGSGVAGINWNSNVMVADLYGSSRVTLQQAIQDATNYARARGQRVVFQGGIQGESWLNDGGTQTQLEQLIRNNSDIAIFAVAAGNGNVDIDNTNPSHPSVRSGESGGVARLQTTHNNVMAVGALENKDSSGNWAHTLVNGLMNAGTVRRADYSNYGASLTLMAATDSPAMDKFGDMKYFNGTSAANPNMAGIASLVWSVNSNLNGGQLRQILIDTAMDIGTAGRDNNFGHGLVNADAAVRRALALSRNNQLASLYSGRSQFA